MYLGSPYQFSLFRLLDEMWFVTNVLCYYTYHLVSW